MKTTTATKFVARVTSNGVRYWSFGDVEIRRMSWRSGGRMVTRYIAVREGRGIAEADTLKTMARRLTPAA